LRSGFSIYPPQNWTHPEPQSVSVEQFLAMFRFEKREKLAELPVDLNRSGQDDFVYFQKIFPNKHIQDFLSMGM
jgi:hypothetical protein